MSKANLYYFKDESTSIYCKQQQQQQQKHNKTRVSYCVPYKMIGYNINQNIYVVMSQSLSLHSPSSGSLNTPTTHIFAPYWWLNCVCNPPAIFFNSVNRLPCPVRAELWQRLSLGKSFQPQPIPAPYCALGVSSPPITTGGADGAKEELGYFWLSPLT